jgi:hypothetical protein
MAEKCRAQSRRRRDVPDAHFPDRQKIAVGRHRPISDIDCREELIYVHRWCHGEVARRSIEINRNDPQLRLSQLGDLVDGRAAGSEVHNHLFGDRLWICGHAVRGDAMIAGEDGDRHPFEVRHFTSLPARHPYHQLFKATETSEFPWSPK